MKGMMNMVKAEILLALVLVSGPLSGRSLLTTLDGTEVVGDVEQEQFEFSSVDGGDLILPRAGLDRLRSLPDGTVEVTLKDGKNVAGTLDSEVTITEGLIKRRFQPGEIREISFDVFVLLTGKNHEVVCPIRAALDVPTELLVGKLKKWYTSRTNMASCEGNRLLSLNVSRQANVLQDRVRVGHEPRKGTVLSIKPRVALAAGEDQFVHLTFILMQGEKVLGTVPRQYSGDEGELNSFPPVGLWLAPEDIVPDGPPLTLRFQMLTRERGTDKKPDAAFMWFVTLRF
jgi:hypothetical protein